ncbi:MAG: two-component system, cell cycle sensor histidine kinase and response regulator CckA, partial [Candidatus Poribacteria bacterium]|nr:two-component system, cell cycle sensor histidine kinase and response regulator CckA [Candidatus Poribacteria bacterium]
MAEDTIQKNEKFYQYLFENMLEGYAYCKMIFENDTPQDFIYIAVNNAFEKLTGLKNVVGKKVSKIILGIKESNPELLQIYGRVVLTGKPESFETYLDSLGLWLSIVVYSPEKEHFVAVFNDITERKQAEKALQHETAKLEAMISGMDEGVILADAQGTIVEINPYFCRFVGMDRANIIGKTMRDFHKDDIMKKIQPHIQKFQSQPNSPPIVIQQPIGNIQAIWRIQPIYLNHVYDGVLLNVIDVTKLLELQASLTERVKELEDALSNIKQLQGLLPIC